MVYGGCQINRVRLSCLEMLRRLILVYVPPHEGKFLAGTFSVSKNGAISVKPG